MTDKCPPLKHIKQNFFRRNIEKRVLGSDTFKHSCDIWFSFLQKTQALLFCVLPLTSNAAVVWSWYWSEVWDNMKDDLSFAWSSFLTKFKISERFHTSLSNFLAIVKRKLSGRFLVNKDINKEPYVFISILKVLRFCTLISTWS